MIKIGHASSDERGKLKGGAAGDQTGREVYIREWYKRPWNVVLRAKDSAVAEKIAMAMEQACANNNIGYDQNQRTTLFVQAQAVGFDLSKIKVKCETDCSALVAVCVNAAGVAVPKDMYTGNERKVLVGTGRFEALTGAKYTDYDSLLKRGDILLYEGHHTAVALENGGSTTVMAELPVLKKGDKGSAVLSLQNLLIHKYSISCGSAGADSSFGNGTETAVKSFQKMKGLAQDGAVGKGTWERLIKG